MRPWKPPVNPPAHRFSFLRVVFEGSHHASVDKLRANGLWWGGALQCAHAWSELVDTIKTGQSQAKLVNIGHSWSTLPVSTGQSWSALAISGYRWSKLVKL